MINPYFANYNHLATQNLLEDLTREMIRVAGVDVWYITRTHRTVDKIYREDDLPLFGAAYQIEMYLKNAESYEGDGSFMSKFGLEIRDQITMVVSRKSFTEILNDNRPRPMEGDLIYVPLIKGMFEINYAPKDTVFYQAGNIHIWELKCERFELSNETFDTGFAEIDNFFEGHVFPQVDDISDLSDFDPFANNQNIQDVSDDVLDFTTLNPLTPTGQW